MKVLIITPGYAVVPDLNGGAVEKLIHTIVTENEKSKAFDLDIISVNDGLNVDVSSYKNSVFYYIDNKNKFYKLKKIFRAFINKIFCFYIGNAYISEAKKIIKKLDCKSYDYVIIENNPLYILNIKKFFACPIYLHLHNDKLNKNSKFNQKIYYLFDKIITVSDFLKNQVEEIGSLNKTYTVYNGIDVHKFSEKQNTNIDILKKNNNIENEIVILYTGRILEIKGVLPLIKVFNKINKHINNIKLIVIGDISNKSDPYIKEVLKESNKNSNILLKGYICNDEIFKYYSISNIQVVPSVCNEALGNTAIEGIASGLVVIVSNRGGLPEIVKNNCGIIFDANDFEQSLYSLLSDVILNYDSYSKMRKKAVIQSEKFDNKYYFENFSNILK